MLCLGPNLHRAPSSLSFMGIIRSQPTSVLLGRCASAAAAAAGGAATLCGLFRAWAHGCFGLAFSTLDFFYNCTATLAAGRRGRRGTGSSNASGSVLLCTYFLPPVHRHHERLDFFNCSWHAVTVVVFSHDPHRRHQQLVLRLPRVEVKSAS